MVQVSVYLMDKQKEVIFGLCPLMTVTEAVLFIEQSDFLPNDYDVLAKYFIQDQTPSHELFLLSTLDTSSKDSKSARGLPLEYHRTLRSYRITQAVCFPLLY